MVGDAIDLGMRAIPILIALEIQREASCSILGEILASVSSSWLRIGMSLSKVLIGRSYVASIQTLTLISVGSSCFCCLYLSSSSFLSSCKP